MDKLKRIIAFFVLMLMMGILFIVPTIELPSIKTADTEIPEDTRVTVMISNGQLLTFEKVTLEEHEYWVRIGGNVDGMVHAVKLPMSD